MCSTKDFVYELRHRSQFNLRLVKLKVLFKKCSNLVFLANFFLTERNYGQNAFEHCLSRS